jgi:hypothetical protein
MKAARSETGLCDSVWHWYDPPDGPLDLDEVGPFYISRELAIPGCSPCVTASVAPAAR